MRSSVNRQPGRGVSSLLLAFLISPPKELCFFSIYVHTSDDAWGGLGGKAVRCTCGRAYLKLRKYHPRAQRNFASLDPTVHRTVPSPALLLPSYPTYLVFLLQLSLLLLVFLRMRQVGLTKSCCHWIFLNLSWELALCQRHHQDLVVTPSLFLSHLNRSGWN